MSTFRLEPFKSITSMSILRSIALIVIVVIMLTLPFFLPPYYIYLLEIIFTTALLAVSLNFILGYGGLLQLHHGVFYGVGAYTVALILTKTSWPFIIAVIAGPIIAAATALVIGWFCVRLRGLYFAMLTLALGQLVWAIIYKWHSFTGGDDGIHSIPVPDFLTSLNFVYYLTFIIMVASLFLIYFIVKSPFGLTLVATRDNSIRSQSVGVNIKRHQLKAFVIAGFFAGISGVLFVFVERSVSPSLLYWSKSAEVLIMCLLGGMATFLGPVLGAAILVVLSMVVGTYTDYWLLVLGLMLLFLVLFLPQGVLGLLTEKINITKKREG